MFWLAGADDKRTTAVRAETFEAFAGKQKGVATGFKINAFGMAVWLEAEGIVNYLVIEVHGIILNSDARGRRAD